MVHICLLTRKRAPSTWCTSVYLRNSEPHPHGAHLFTYEIESSIHMVHFNSNLLLIDHHKSWHLRAGWDRSPDLQLQRYGFFFNLFSVVDVNGEHREAAAWKGCFHIDIGNWDLRVICRYLALLHHFHRAHHRFPPQNLPLEIGNMMTDESFSLYTVSRNAYGIKMRYPSCTHLLKR